MTLHSLPPGARMLGIGEYVQSGDLMQIGAAPTVSYQPVVTAATCGLRRQQWHQDRDCGSHGGAGHRVENKHERYWRLA